MGSTEPYDDAARARWVSEAPKQSARTPFERDRARLVHSAALRRLAAKTQVVGPDTDDFVRNRLTHTLEVAQVARDLGRRLGCDPDVVETAALAHDIGHPPFGHNGERALDDAGRTCGGFEGNAQTLRVLTRLEAKTTAPDGSSVGLNLTRATLDAATKYPWPRSVADPHKFGVYAEDLAAFTWIREGAPGRRRCVEAQVMDLADDVAYSVHDVEDGIVAGRIDPAALSDRRLRGDIWGTVRGWYLPDADDHALEEAFTGITGLPAWPHTPYDGSRSSLAALKNLTSDLIGRFCGQVQDATSDAYGEGPFARYAADLEVPAQTTAEIAVLKGIAAHLVMRADDRVGVLAEQRDIVAELVGVLLERGPSELEAAFRDDFSAAADDAGRLRVVLDQVASLTDASAIAWHRRLGGRA